MRNALIAMVLVLFSVACLADLGPLHPLGAGHFAGKPAIYASGETLAMVYFDQQDTDPNLPGWIVFRKSTDGGANWSSQNVVSATGCLTQPTLSYTDQEILIAYTSDMERLLAKSYDGGNTWQTWPDAADCHLGKTWESSPYVERQNGELRLAALELPYPEYAQQDFAHPDDPELLQAPIHFCDNELSTNGTSVYYYGLDTVHGIVRANSDIWIKQVGGGANNGWPTFTAPVIISGEVQSFSGAYPEAEVFQGGLIEHAPALVYEDAPQITDSILLGPPVYDPDRIVFVTVNGDSYTAMLGQLSEPRTVYADVYSIYPPANVDNFLYQNSFAVRDTLWTPLPDGSCANTTLEVMSKLWIRGTFGTHQTWIARDTLYILDDILLTNTAAGSDPQSNLTDSVNLVSHKSILLKYGYVNPADSLRYHPLCRPDSSPINIYANLYALGNNPGNTHKMGVFSFEYQHPHPSAPSGIDLHRYRYPQTFSHPWASTQPGSINLKIDLPWYNPLWPEAMPYLERGTVNIWGSVNQRLRGYLHRSYYDSEWLSNGVWDPDIDYCGGSSASSTVNHNDPVLGIALGTHNYPATTGSGVGYKRSYHADSRNSMDARFWKTGLALGSLTAGDNGELEFDSQYLKKYAGQVHTKGFDRRSNRALYSLNDLLLFAEGDNVADWSASTEGHGLIRSLDLDGDGSALVMQESQTPAWPTLRILALNPGTGSIDYEITQLVSTSINATAIMPDGRRFLAIYDSGHISVFQISAGASIPVACWQADLGDPGQYDLALSRIFLVPAGDDALDVFFCLSATGTEPNQPGSVFHARAFITVSSDDPGIPPIPQPSLTAWPNPASGQINIKLQMEQGSQPVVEVYNLRGQKVRSLIADKTINGSEFEYLWDGLDDKGKPAGRGVYFLRATAAGKTIPVKRICLI